MKKVIALVLAAAIMLSASILAVNAADTPQFELLPEAQTPGETVDMALNIHNNPGIAAFKVEIVYPREQFAFISVNGQGSFQSNVSLGPVETGEDDTDSFILSWHSSNSANVSQNGTVAMLSFRVLSLEQFAIITLKYDADDVINNALENQFFEVKPAIFSTHTHTPAAAVRENEKAPACTVPGSYEEVVYCTVCSQEISRKREEIPATGHDYQITVTEEPACLKTGLKTLTCRVCGEEHEELIPVKAHQFVTQEVAATCSAMGYTLYTCSDCGYTYHDDYVPMEEHQFVLSVVGPTTEAQGYTVHTCAVCGYSFVDSITDVLPSEHNYIIPSLEQIQATLIIKNGDNAYEVTSVNGVFQFDNVPDATYRVYAKQKNSITLCIGEYDAKSGTTVHNDEVVIPLGNYNDDDIINVEDINLLLQSNVFGKRNEVFDLNDDSIVDIADLSVILCADNYGRCSDEII